MPSPLPYASSKHTVEDRRAELTLNVVTDDRQVLPAKLLAPFRIRGNEDRHTIDHRDAHVQTDLGIVVDGIFGTDRQIADQDLRAGRLPLLQYPVVMSEN